MWCGCGDNGGHRTTSQNAVAINKNAGLTCGWISELTVLTKVRETEREVDYCSFKMRVSTNKERNTESNSRFVCIYDYASVSLALIKEIERKEEGGLGEKSSEKRVWPLNCSQGEGWSESIQLENRTKGDKRGASLFYLNSYFLQTFYKNNFYSYSNWSKIIFTMRHISHFNFFMLTHISFTDSW